MLPIRPIVTLLACLLALSSCHTSAEKPTTRTGQAIAPATVQQSSPPKAQEPQSTVAARQPSLGLRDLPDPKAPLHPFDDDVVTGRAVVTSVERQASDVGLQIVADGGNAVDAAVATAFALAVTHPSAGNLGGGGFLLLRLGDRLEAIDFRENSPAGLTDAAFWKMIEQHGQGGAAVGVPGTVAGLWLAHSRYGKLPWKRVLQGALHLAQNGYVVGKRQADVIRWARSKLARDEVAREVFLSPPPKVGDRVFRPRLGIALQRIAEQGPQGFYQGPTANDIIASVGPEGLLTLKDLDHYQARVRDPLYFDFEGLRVITMPPPSGGGVVVTQNLLMLQASGILNHQPGSVEWLHLFAEASRRAQVERRLVVVSPDVLDPSKIAANRRRWLDANTWLGPHPIDRSHATSSSLLHPLFASAMKEVEHTTHLSVVDDEGGAVSCTVTLSGSFGSGVFSRETGIALNNSVASFSSVGENVPAPGQRTVSSMAPTLALSRNGDVLVLGSPGGDTIPSTITQVLLRLAAGQTLHKAAVAPRIHQGFVPPEIGMERRRPLSAAQKSGLRKRGHSLAATRSTIGDANIAAYFAGRAGAVHDPREGGLAAALPVQSKP